MRKLSVVGLLIFSYLTAVASEPANQPTNFTSSVIKPYSFTISFTGSGADGYLVLRSTSPITSVPADGTPYQKGGSLGSAKVFSSSGITNVQVKEVVASTEYYFAIFAYNGSGSSIDYKQTNPLTGVVTSTGSQMGSYYNSLDQNSTTFIADLKNRINTGKIFVPYGNYASNIAPGFFEHDTTNSQKYVMCEYSHEKKLYNGSFSFVAIDYSREHSLCKSWMPTGGSTSTVEGSDYHNLYLTNLSDVNSPRSNWPYGEVVTVTDSYLEFQMGNNSLGNKVAEPADDIKGDVARSQFYMLVCYNGLSGSWGYNSLSSYGPNQNVDVLLTWHVMDPPSAKEIAKHEYIYGLQNNRNPFIDHPEWVDCINFRTLTLYAGCTYSVGMEEQYDNFMINTWPNPAASQIQVLIQKTFPGTTIQLLDMNGKLVYAKSLDFSGDDVQQTIDVSGFSNGLYFVRVLSPNYSATQKIMIQN